MKSERLKSNQVAILLYLLTHLEKRIYLLRLSLYGDAKKYFRNDSLVTKANLELKDEDLNTKFNMTPEDFRLITESCEIETFIRRILHEMKSKKSFESLKEVIGELKNESTALRKNQRMIEEKREQIHQLRKTLFVLEDQVKSTVKLQHAKDSLDTEKREDDAVTVGGIDFLKKLMNTRKESKNEYYDSTQREIKEKIEVHTQKLDRMLKEMFDNWSAKRRELGILKKYRRLNLEKIQALQKLILEREDYIRKDKALKEELRKKREEELKREYAATTIQAYWRGTMVRKHLGPYKVKTPKKGKGKKGKGKKK